MPIEKARDVFAQPIEPGTLAPIPAADRAREEKVAFEQRRHGCGEARIRHLLVGFEIPPQAPAIEIARADGYPVITKNRLGVQHVRLVFEDLYAAAQHLAIEAPCGLPH